MLLESGRPVRRWWRLGEVNLGVVQAATGEVPDGSVHRHFDGVTAGAVINVWVMNKGNKSEWWEKETRSKERRRGDE